jgi:hypothetical protein
MPVSKLSNMPSANSVRSTRSGLSRTSGTAEVNLTL